MSLGKEYTVSLRLTTKRMFKKWRLCRTGFETVFPTSIRKWIDHVTSRIRVPLIFGQNWKRAPARQIIPIRTHSELTFKKRGTRWTTTTWSPVRSIPYAFEGRIWGERGSYLQNWSYPVKKMLNQAQGFFKKRCLIPRLKLKLVIPCFHPTLYILYIYGYKYAIPKSVTELLWGECLSEYFIVL